MAFKRSPAVLYRAMPLARRVAFFCQAIKKPGYSGDGGGGKETRPMLLKTAVTRPAAAAEFNFFSRTAAENFMSLPGK